MLLVQLFCNPRSNQQRPPPLQLEVVVEAGVEVEEVPKLLKLWNSPPLLFLLQQLPEVQLEVAEVEALQLEVLCYNSSSNNNNRVVLMFQNHRMSK